MIAKASWALLPLLFIIEQDATVCAHRDGVGPTQAIDVTSIEKAYRKQFSAVSRFETSSTKWKSAPLPACAGKQTRRVEIEEVSEKLVGKKWVFSSDPVSADSARWFHVRCVKSTVTIVDRTHLEIVEE